MQSESPADSSRLPAAPFESCGLTPRRPPAVPSDWSRHLATAFPSEEFPAFASLSCRICFRSVRLTAPPLSPVRPGLGGLNTADPLPDASPAIPVFPPACAPLWGFTPSGSKRLPNSYRVAHLPDATVGLSLPAPVSILLVPVADQRSRLASLPKACCSSNLLEPSVRIARFFVAVK